MKSKEIIKKLTEFIPNFKNRIEHISVLNIEPNEFNPRKKYGQQEEDELISSINSKGILQPIIVYEKKNKKGEYVLLDGQRRYQACKKLNIDNVPAHILENEPKSLENLSLMFHIHNVHEEWTEVAIAKILETIIRDLKINKKRITKEEKKELQKITSLSKYKLNKFLKVLKYSKPVIDKFLESELKENPDLDLDLLTELKRPLNRLKEIIPSIIQIYPEKEFVDKIIQKKKDKIITTNKQLRKITKIVRNVEAGKINEQIAKEKIISFLENRNLTIEDIYSDTSEAIEQAKEIRKISNKLKREVDNIDLRKVPEEDKKQLKIQISQLMESLKRILQSH
ncbi:MAG: ParB/RepB/Spo0J family partition protein [archaeon]